MIPDWYSILGIASASSFDEIEHAFHLQSARCHPQRGGSHEAMARAVAAYRVLADPQWRAEYDYAIARPHVAEAQQRAARTAEAAQQQAEDYPRQWETFARWRDRFGEERRAATAPWEEGQPLTAASHACLSAFVFIGMLGGLMAYCALVGEETPLDRLFAIPFVAAGAWLGTRFRRFIERILEATRLGG